MNKIIKPRSKYHLKLIQQVHDEKLKEGFKDIYNCDATRNIFANKIKEIANLDKQTAEIHEMLDLFALRTIYHSIVDIRPVENKCNPNVITERGRRNDDNDNIGIVIPENQYEVLEYRYAISQIPNPVELGLKGNFDTKDRFICSNIRRDSA